MDTVSVIIPTFNRFSYVLNAIQSVKEQTYPHIEIIVINDCSTDPRYYEYNWEEIGVHILHLKKNTKQIFGYACAGYVRNCGIEISTGKYIAFCDDDDIWFSSKIERQLKAMKEVGVLMCCTEGIIGNGTYNGKNTYPRYNGEYYYQTLQNIYRSKGSPLLENGFPKIWTSEFLNVHNCIVPSSVLLDREVLRKINNMNIIRNGEEDYDCWKRALEHTNCLYLDDICFYYDSNHADGRNY
jgi:glycosyltransferase involved in cell wall biosynthesis